MLIPAIYYKEELTKAFRLHYYTEDMMYITGSLCSWTPTFDDNPEKGHYQFAIVNPNKELIGYIDYYIDYYSSSVSRFGLYSFSRGNFIVGRDVLQELERIVASYHRVEWRMLGGNPIERHYDKFCEAHNGTKHVFRDAMRDRSGKYHDDILYEIINPNV